VLPRSNWRGADEEELRVATQILDEEEVWERLLDVIEREAGVERERLAPSARFVDDLGMD
jgi:hypothetical protein